MRSNTPSDAALSVAGEGALFLASAPLFYKCGGWLPVLLYLFLCLALLRFRVYSLNIRWKPATVAAGSLLVLGAAFLLLHHLLGNAGGDRGDALSKAAGALLRGVDPYAQKTFLGNPITPLPGALLFGAPFVVFGNGLGLQTLLWLAAFLWVLGSWYGLTARNRALLVLALSPVVLQDLVQGGDYIANALYVFVLAVSCVRIRGRGLWLVSVLLGLALASRPAYWIVPFLFYPALSGAHGSKKAVAAVASAVLAAAGLTACFVLAFYPGNVGGFPPFHVFDKCAVPAWQFLVFLVLAVPVFLLGVRSFSLHQDRVVDACAKFSLLLSALVLGGFCLHYFRDPAWPAFNGTFYLTQASCVWPFALLACVAR